MRDNYLEEYYSFLRFPSVSTDAKFADKVRECAAWGSQKASQRQADGFDLRPSRRSAAGPARIVGLAALRASLEGRLRLCPRRDRQQRPDLFTYSRFAGNNRKKS